MSWKQLKELVPFGKKGHCFQGGKHKLENSSLLFGQGYNTDVCVCVLSATIGGHHPCGDEQILSQQKLPQAHPRDAHIHTQLPYSVEVRVLD